MTSTVNLPAMYGELSKFISISDHRQALKAANKILHTKEGNADVEAMHCKVVCLIQMTQFAEALKFIDATEEIENVLVFEKAYCQYRLLQTEAALETINDSGDLSNLGLIELKAQILYKLGQYSESLSLYKKLIKECSDEYEDERMTNISAVHAALSAFQGVKTEIGFEAESYEQLYNKACWLLGRGEVAEAKAALVKAEKECRELYADEPDMTAEEIEAEVSVIRVQLGYCLQLEGKEDEALTIYNQVIRSRPTDIGLVAVASNNIISINKDQNVFDSRKKMKATTANGVGTKLVKFQKNKIDFNRALLFMYSNQWEACRKLLKSLHKEYRGSDTPCLIQAAQLMREKNAGKATDYLKTYIEEHSDSDLTPQVDLTNVKLALVQMYLTQGQLLKACQVLESLEDLSFTPGMVSCLVSLYNAQNDGMPHAIDFLARAVDWHKKNESPKETLIEIMWEASLFNIKHNNMKAAAAILEDILRIDQKNVKVLAKLIYAYSQFNPTKANQISEDLPTLAELSVTVDVDDLERNIGRLTPRYVKKQKEKKESAVAASSVAKKDVVSEGSLNLEAAKTKKKKKKKNPVPKNFEPNYVPDPERWLPLKERSYYKGKRRDRKKVGKGTQGLAYGASSDAYDMSYKSSPAPNSPKPGTAPTGSSGNTPVNSPKPTQNKGASKAKKPANKKKKKGKGGW